MPDCKVANHAGLLEGIPVLPWKVLHPGKPLGPRQTGMVNHSLSMSRQEQSSKEFHSTSETKGFNVSGSYYVLLMIS